MPCTTIQLRTGVWHGEVPLTLDFPENWNTTVFWPKSPAPLSDEEIMKVLEHPVAQCPIRLACRGKHRPVVIVDDLNRPTPASRVMPFLLKHFEEAGIGSQDITILMAPGTHGPPSSGAMLKKIGSEAASACRLVIHDHTRDVLKVGKTSFGTPVFVNREVLKADFVVGIGGIYPNYSAGFGGGSKLALGVLGTSSIRGLHYGHSSMGWGRHGPHNNFRKDLDEIALMIGLRTTISLHIDAARQVVGVRCGDPCQYFEEAAAFAKQMFKVPEPRNADVVISNAYPGDSSLLFARMKGFSPLNRCRPGATRIAIASCSEGIGRHDLFPLSSPMSQRFVSWFQRISRLGPRRVMEKAANKVSRKRKINSANHKNLDLPTQSRPHRPIWLYRPGDHEQPVACPIADISIKRSWSEIKQVVRQEQGDRNLKVLVYPCAPLQCFDDEP